jgi:hypothetical protein
MSVVYLNGQFLPSHEARVPVDDRGFLFGDGVYEVTRSLGGRLFAEEAHWRRLETGLAQLRIQPPPDFTRERVRAISERLLAENGLTEGEATVYLQVTRGAAPRTHAFPPALLSDVLTVFLRAVFALQRRRARRQGMRGGQVGAVSFIQFFGSALQVTPHFHSLVPDGVFVPREGGVRLEALPPPTQGEVEQLLRVVRHRVLRLLEKRGALPAQGPEDALQAYQAHSQQQRLRWTEVDVRPPPRKQPRCALLEGFSLHAKTHLHANDRQGLVRLCR